MDLRFFLALLTYVWRQLGGCPRWLSGVKLGHSGPFNAAERVSVEDRWELWRVRAYRLQLHFVALGV